MRPCIFYYKPGTEFFSEELCHITELLNSEEHEELSIAMARVEPGVTTQWHCLVGTTERYLIVSGHGIVEIGDLPPQHVGPNDVVVIPPGCKQRITNLGTSDLIFYAICTPRFRPHVYKDLKDCQG